MSSKKYISSKYSSVEETNVSNTYQGRGNSLKSKLTALDAFGQPVNEFNYQGSSTYKSWYGGLTTVFSVILLAAMLSIKISNEYAP